MKQGFNIIVLMCLVMAPFFLWAQVGADSILLSGTIENVIQYALKHQPVIQSALLDEQITKSQVNSRLADWYPQIGYNYNLQHNFQLPTTVFQGTVVTLGNQNTSVNQFAYNQNILNPALVFTATTAKTIRRQAAENTTNNKIELVAQVSKAFYDVLLTQQQIKVADEDIVRLQRSVKDAKAQYQSGIADKTDYQRATILLNNATALKKSNEEALTAKLVYLKSIMGYPAKAGIELVYDTAQMENNVSVAVPENLDYSNRIEFEQLQTQRQLQVANLKYAKFSFLPNVSGFAAYNMNYLNNSAAELYKINYPSSYAGITIGVPIVQGGKRWMNIRQAKWQLKRADLSIEGLQHNMDAEYAQALAAYNSNLANFTAMKENVVLAKDVHTIIEKQYRSGIKTYLEVLVAESDLRAAQINYYNALYQVLSGKVDLQKALGQLKY